ncbi:hypothetical protein L1987_50052 [Smallanthus sonchifolius]|uniref:Uncharacterized protein n=1 Tax=Smallanthus sonchifolius TaxID=185202 RepID=A0ACB9FXE4_9ASTR|nr:hypothetical protein L1987_50052 [Smallanthus sonchifolius]
MTLLRRSESPWGYSKMQQFIKRPDSLFLSWNDSSFVIHSINQTSDADMEDYVFEYSEEEPEEQDVDIENQYCNSKGAGGLSVSNLSILWDRDRSTDPHGMNNTGVLFI